MLNWYALQPEIQRYIERCKEHKLALAEYRRLLLDELRTRAGQEWETWKERVQKASELIPDFDESPANVYPVQSPKQLAVLLASDGSQIYPSHHEVANVALVNVSRIRIDYKNYHLPPLMDTQAALFVYEDLLKEFSTKDDTLLPSFRDAVNDRRDVQEMAQLSALAGETAAGANKTPSVALSDGSLIQWHWQSRKHDAYRNGLLNEYCGALMALQNQGVPVAGYLSGSRSQDVVRLMQLIRNEARESLSLAELAMSDTSLFSRWLQPGQRTPVFYSRAEILQAYPLEQRVGFFYLHVGYEIARVELPLWAAQPPWLDPVAKQCLRQAELGAGYPVVLSEAHEHAIIRGAEREQFYALLEQEGLRQGLTAVRSPKQQSKRSPLL